MAILNEKNEQTKRIIHILITGKCNRNCKYCCNRQYDLEEIEVVSDEELREAEILCLTGGEPFLYTDPCKIAYEYKKKYPNIKYVYVYTNAFEFYNWYKVNKIHSIDGINVSIKNKLDAESFKEFKDSKDIVSLNSNLLYIFNNLYSDTNIEGFKVYNRKWQEDFVPANDSIFRRVKNIY